MQGRCDRRIRLWERDGRLYFEIVDDGVGYDVESARHAGQGLTNMSERIAAAGGTLVVESTPGRGTTVRGNIPVADAARQRVGPAAGSGRVAVAEFALVSPTGVFLVSIRAPVSLWGASTAIARCPVSIVGA